MSDAKERELETRLERALDALNAEQAPPVFEDDDTDYLELVDVARIAHRLREPSEPDGHYPRELAARITADFTSPVESSAVTEPNHRTEHAAARIEPSVAGWVGGRAQLSRLVYTLGAGVIAGALAGIVAGGIGGRIAMLVSGLLYIRENPDAPVTTESSGRVVGEFSVGGTVDLLFEGMFSGIAGGLLYVLLRRWLPEGAIWRGLSFGLAALAIAGTATIDADNSDFARLGIPWLNVLMFGLIFLAFGLIAAPIAERILSQWSDVHEPTREATPRDLLYGLAWPAGVLGLLFSAVLMVVTTILGGRELIRMLAGGAGVFDTVPEIVAMVVIVALPLLRVLSSPIVAARAGERSSMRGSGERHWWGHFDLAARLAVGSVIILGTVLLVHTTFLIVT